MRKNLTFTASIASKKHLNKINGSFIIKILSKLIEQIKTHFCPYLNLSVATVAPEGKDLLPSPSGEGLGLGRLFLFNYLNIIGLLYSLICPYLNLSVAMVAPEGKDLLPSPLGKGWVGAVIFVQLLILLHKRTA
ncbi:MAG: hypothetical protein EAZ08_10750 [Cytophagales bacterium]|nr:MAG: hypothetical protein EAZ08_10750 [Cytophagales bacterium]